MNFFRRHWYDIGGFLSLLVLLHIFLHRNTFTDYQLLMWISLLTLFLHQLEEYRIAGTFPGMINTIMFNSKEPDRYPLNTNTALIINTGVGWSVYFLAALFAEKVVWLGMAAILVSAGNIIAHAFIFNLKGKTIYNAGMITCLLLFLPCTYFFFKIIYNYRLAGATDYMIGVPLGLIINVVGVFKMIQWLADENTPYVFEKRNLLKQH